MISYLDAPEAPQIASGAPLPEFSGQVRTPLHPKIILPWEARSQEAATCLNLALDPASTEHGPTGRAHRTNLCHRRSQVVWAQFPSLCRSRHSLGTAFCEPLQCL